MDFRKGDGMGEAGAFLELSASALETLKTLTTAANSSRGRKAR